jgi:hypothetical protein
MRHMLFKSVSLFSRLIKLMQSENPTERWSLSTAMIGALGEVEIGLEPLRVRLCVP